ncbi:hypothetical protein EDB87DRAFT_304141 [Lactarius vividus]|nr:hypothetical protein EDB87DRAFT_304141 [Lactarius vividus]
MVERTRVIRQVQSAMRLVPQFDKGICRYQEDPVGASVIRPRRRGEHMIKQTYSVFVRPTDGMNFKKWHLNAYWTQEDLDQRYGLEVKVLCGL